MATRTESAASTRRDLLDAAAELLDTGGLDAVTLRGVGARAGDPAEAIRAAGRSRDEFRAIVATLVELVTAT